MDSITPQHMTFTAAERAILADTVARGFTVDTCADDGHEWAAVAPATIEHDRFSFDDPHTLALSIQLTPAASRRCVALASDGRTVLASGDDLAGVLSAAGIAA
mgnify:CR=1 FL=1